MFRPRNSLTSTALLLVMLSAPATAQDAPAEDAGAPVVAAYQTYAGARTALVSGIADGGDVQAQLAAAQQARANLEAACAAAGTPDLAVCVDTYVSADMRIEGDISPLPEVPAMAAAPAAEETQPEQSQAVEPEQTPAEEPVTEEPVAEEPVAEEPAAEEPVAEEAQPAEPEAAAESEAAPEAETDAASETDAETTAAPAAETQVDPVSEGAEVQAAYAAYADARAVLRKARQNEGDVAGAAQGVNLAFDGLMDACSQLGTPDLAACLDLYISADTRLRNDLNPVDVPSATDEEDASDEETAPPAPDDEETAAPAPEDVAPVLDSEKEAEAEGGADAQADADTGSDQADQSENTEPAPQSDEEAQTNAEPQDIRGSDDEAGEEISQDEGRQATRQRNGPDNAEVVQQNEFRVVFQFGDQLVVRSQDNARLGYEADDTRYERLSNNRYRETIFRANESQLVTIYNRNGDILQRSVIEPDGSEYFLIYTPQDRYDDVLNWRDPAQDLPPLRLTIPASEYVLDARTSDEQRIYEFLSRPPVERTSRLYSVDEVKRSARLRDVMRRLEIGDLTFDTNSAALSAEQFGSLSTVAEAMKQLLADNPGELFLIEGHTDAVGSDISNLGLSDRRAETVAIVLTQTFGIPPENLATQGYGERYLAVRTQGAERLNRRVTVKRITPLVSPGTTAAAG